MRSCVLICSMALLAIPAATTFSQNMAGSDSGIYFDVGGAVMLPLTEIDKVKFGGWFEEDGQAYYYDDGTKKKGIPSLNEFSQVDSDIAYGWGWALRGALGYRFGELRAEAEVSYGSANLNKTGGNEIEEDKYDTLPSLSILSFMANGWYEFDTGTMFSPFIGLGLGGFQGTVGGGKGKGESDAIDSTGWGVAFQGGVGVAVEVTEGLSVQLGYRLFWAPLETTYTHESTGEQQLAPLKAVGVDADKVITGIAFPLMVHRIELGVSYLLPL